MLKKFYIVFFLFFCFVVKASNDLKIISSSQSYLIVEYTPEYKSINDIKTDIEKAGKNKEINEDEKFRFIKELDEEISGRNDGIKSIRDKKEQEIMTI